jgi:signal-transduction protein with cAMP-binding, CBS, and nucleotidyltransferase domain
MLAAQFCREQIPRLRAEATLESAAEELSGAGCELVVVVDAEQHPLGLLTVTDLLKAVLLRHQPSDGPVSALLADEPQLILEDTALGAALRRMSDDHTRHLLVVDAAGQLIGVVSQANILEQLSQGVDIG